MGFIRGRALCRRVGAVSKLVGTLSVQWIAISSAAEEQSAVAEEIDSLANQQQSLMDQFRV